MYTLKLEYQYINPILIFKATIVLYYQFWSYLFHDVWSFPLRLPKSLCTDRRDTTPKLTTLEDVLIQLLSPIKKGTNERFEKCSVFGWQRGEEFVGSKILANSIYIIWFHFEDTRMNPNMFSLPMYQYYIPASCSLGAVEPWPVVHRYHLSTIQHRQATRPLCARGAFASLGAGPVCASFSRAVRPAVRTKQQPEGLREISANMAAKVLTGNSMSSWLCRLLRICLDRGMCFWVENPALSFLWDQPCWRSLIEEYKLGFFTTDYCRWGTPWRKTDEVSDISRTRLRRSLLSCGRTSGFLCRGRPSCIICRSRTSGLLGWFPW